MGMGIGSNEEQGWDIEILRYDIGAVDGGDEGEGLKGRALRVQ